MWKDKIMWGSLGAGFLCWGLAYWLGGTMTAMAEEEILWANEPFWLMVLIWGGALLLFSRFMTSMAGRRKMVGASILSGLLFWAGFMPNYFILGPFLGFVPLLWVENEIWKERASRRTSFWTVFKFAFVAFMTWNFLSTSWVINTGFVAGLLANVLNAILMTIPFVLFHVVRKAHNEKVGYLAFISLWLAFEWWHFYWDLSWPWLALGHSFGHLPQVIQWYEWLGVSGGSLWILWVNLVVWQDLGAATWRERLKRPIIWLVGPMLLSLGMYFMHSDGAARRVEVVLVQPNFEPHYEKFGLSTALQFPRFIELMSSKIGDSTGFVVFPETSFDGIEIDKIADDNWIMGLRGAMKSYPNTVLVTGIGAFKIYRDEASAPADANRRCRRDGTNCIIYAAYNSAIQLENGKDSIPIYHKSKLVPGSESMPYVSGLEIFKQLIMDLGGVPGRGLSTQENRVVFSSPRGKIAPIICYESVYGDYVADYTRRGAELFFVMTNDGWWGDTYGYRQHKYLSAIRAIENRRWVARAANTGTTCFINSRGDILEQTAYGVPTAIKGEMPLLTGRTFFVQLGDLIGRISCLLALLVLGSTVGKWVVPSRSLVGQMRKDNEI